MNLLRGFLDNDSAFGRLMTRCWIVIACNVLFVLLLMPLVTAGAGWAAMDFCLLRTLRGDGDLNPVKEFWRGLRENWKQATICWMALLILLAFLGLEWNWCGQFGGGFLTLRLGLGMIAAAAVILGLYLFPVMAAFRAEIPALLRHSLYFAFRKPLKLLVILFFHLFPLLLTYSDLANLPLYAFLWCFFGFGAVELLTASLLLPEFAPFLPPVDAYGERIPDPAEGEEADGAAARGGPEKSEAEILQEMKELGM